MTNVGTIFVSNVAQLVLLQNELLGQFSDGYWENSRNQSWEHMSFEKIEIDAENPRIEFEGHKPYDYKGYSCNNKTLVEIVGDRMVAFMKYAKKTGKSPETYEGYVLENFTNISKEQIDRQITDWNNSGDSYYQKKGKLAKKLIQELGKEGLMETITVSSNDLKELRKELRDITKILKNVKVK